MADFVNNYVQIHDFDSTTNITATNPAGQTLTLATAGNGNYIEGGNGVEWKTTATGVNTISINNSAGGQNKPFKVTESDFLIWFYYVKGKGSAILTDNDNSFTIRLFFGAAANNDYVDYYQGGDSTIPFGWETYRCSGKNGVIPVGSNHNNGSDWDLDITQIDLLLDVANANDVSSGTDTPLIFDECRYGNNITITSGTSATPIDADDLVVYDADDGTLTGGEERPLGVVTFADNLLRLNTGLKIGNGSNGIGNEGHFAASGTFLLFNQGSEEVKYNLVVNSYSSCILGELRTGIDNNYPIDGCQVVQPSGSYGKIDIKSGAIFKIYDTKLYRWRNIYLGGPSPSGAPTVIDFKRVDIDSCETVFINKPVTWDDVEVHDNTALVSAHSGQIISTPKEFKNVKVYNCKEGFHFNDNVIVNEYFATDNDDYDLGVLGGKTATIIDGIFDENKIKRIKR